ncbi:MAG: hypothetical protein Q8K99_05680 [Actinomycetota bacterium]|nr:hypothetical protein [Actinomycetota bacterium]
MQKAGFCSACNENVYLTETGECSKGGHASNCITGVYDVVQGQEAPTSAAPAAAPAVPVKVKKPFYKKWWVWAIAIVFVAAIASAGGGGSGEDSTASETSKPAESVPAETAEEPAAKTEEPAAEEVVTKIGDSLKVGDLVFTVKEEDHHRIEERPWQQGGQLDAGHRVGQERIQRSYHDRHQLL